jgi:hypothetical protein
MLEDVTPYSQDIKEYVERWIIEKVVFREDEIITSVNAKGKIIKYHPVHPKGSSNRRWLEESMIRDLENLIEMYKNGVA